MPKRKLKVVAKIENYLVGEVKWKRAIYKAVKEAQRDAGVVYFDDDKLEVEICFHLESGKARRAGTISGALWRTYGASHYRSSANHALTGVAINYRLFEPRCQYCRLQFFCYSPLDVDSLSCKDE